MTTVAIFDQKWRAQTRENDKSTESAGSWGIWETVGGEGPSDDYSLSPDDAHLRQQRGGLLHNF